MRFFEFVDDSGDKLIITLRNYIGRAASKKAPAKLNWNGFNKILASNGFEQAADFETFKSIYDGSPAIQSLVKNFNATGLELNVPGAPDEQPASDGATTATDSQAAVDKAAATAAPQQLAAQA